LQRYLPETYPSGQLTIQKHPSDLLWSGPLHSSNHCHYSQCVSPK
jgi:hypothetical protein